MTRPVESHLSILRQEKDWLAVDKPSGLSVHNSEDPENLLSLLQKQLGLMDLYPIHRLDKETSGLQLLALNDKAASRLATQFQDRKVQKFYQGIVAGSLPEKGVWNHSLSDQAEGWKNPAGLAQNRIPCETHFQVLKFSNYFSWLEFEILTGRQHQIRKHCALAGRALIGDPRYGNPKYNQKIAELYSFNRMALHCWKIILEDNTSLEAPVPPEFQKLFQNPESKQ
ncbi:MAG: RluA family pseudouridine synthase [Pseudobdellovibrionaceae bacterium]